MMPLATATSPAPLVPAHPDPARQSEPWACHEEAT
eukprot:CAMPEP_0174347670 /NCGR_PEP_ID=MMETSP0811_2-20130205/3808_1 /TAXON_ID=73025 ORGANISM="Eutreptiella gymnastica-like, Strain CCMP1594" /NCGR_SAMPLE_ID=MMETSP0811_2 /ASSEMBLY_ACC=CAM_ASM_000667 /LENGTH=34 /DNA_ID= /DNA_START= /DNA_END= /DNA_ORIENTATION=